MIAVVIIKVTYEARVTDDTAVTVDITLTTLNNDRLQHKRVSTTSTIVVTHKLH